MTTTMARGSEMKTTIEARRSFSFGSPLRYPGGKTRAASLILDYVPESVKTLVSPFLGGASVELAATQRGVRVFGYDLFAPLVTFWQCLLEDPHELARRAEGYLPLSREEFQHLQREIEGYRIDRFEYAAIFFVINRSSFSGSTLSGGMSPGHPRFTPSAIERVRQFLNPCLEVRRASFEDSLARHPSTFAYLDPPYLIESALYGNRGDTHRGFDHTGLCDLMRARGGWVLSYNDCPEIRRMYQGYRILTPTWQYGMSADKRSREVLILSGDF